MDHVESRIDRYHDLPDAGTSRSTFFVAREYFAVLDQMTATAPHRYDELLHFGGKEGATRIEGTLTLAHNELRWATLNEAGEPVELRAIFVGPDVAFTTALGYTNWRPGQTLDHTFVRAAATGSNVTFLMLLLPRRATEADAALTRVPGGVRLDLGGRIDTHAVGAGGTIAAGPLTATAAYAWAREVAGKVAAVGMKAGRSLAYGGTTWLASSVELTVAADFSNAAAYQADIAAPGGAYTVEIALPGGKAPSSVTLADQPARFTVANGRAVVQASGGGTLLVKP
jgi:hypothetical protein